MFNRRPPNAKLGCLLPEGDELAAIWRCHFASIGIALSFRPPLQISTLGESKPIKQLQRLPHQLAVLPCSSRLLLAWKALCITCQIVVVFAVVTQPSLAIRSCAFHASMRSGACVSVYNDGVSAIASIYPLLQC